MPTDSYSLDHLRRVCLLADQDEDGKAIESEFDAIADPILEPWDDIEL